jgi:hypothetical protein
MPVYRRCSWWDFRPAHCEGPFEHSSQGLAALEERHRSFRRLPRTLASMAPGTAQRCRNRSHPRCNGLHLAPLPPRDAPSAPRIDEAGGIWHPALSRDKIIRCRQPFLPTKRRRAPVSPSGNEANVATYSYLANAVRLLGRHGAPASRKPISYRSPIPFPQFLHSLVTRRQKSGAKLLARSLELCKCSCDRTARLSNLRERPVSPDAFHTPVRLARLTRAETEGWGLIEPE